MLLTGVIGVAIVGYVVGINDGVPREDFDGPAAQLRDGPAADALVAGSSGAMPATSYSEMRQSETGPTSKWTPSLERIHSGTAFQRCIRCHDPHSAEVKPSEKDKLRSLSTRSARRAFNGAPPVIPHAVEQTDDAACYACHGEGARVGQRVANRMSHGLLANCLQCHAAPPPKPFAHLQFVAANTFEGLKAPTSGERAFPGAPPVIPTRRGCENVAFPATEEKLDGLVSK